MTLPSARVFEMLENDFVVGWKNIVDEDYVGASHGYTCEEAAVGTTNGAGARNIQIFVLSKGGIVCHCLPGFWHPEDFAHELQFAKVLDRLWNDDRKISQKRTMFTRMQLSAIRAHPEEMTARSGWQGFDAANERQRLEHGPRDTFYYDAQGNAKDLKPISVLVHERMAQRPFRRIQAFDTEEFIDYGRPYYDNNGGRGVGVTFGSDGFMESQKRMAEKRRERQEAKEREAERRGKPESGGDGE